MPDLTPHLGLSKPLDNDTADIDVINGNMDIIDSSVYTAQQTAESANTAITNHANDKNNPHGVTKAQIGLGNVDNVKQATKTEFDAHVNNKSNPHGVTPAQIGALPSGGGKVTGPVDFETTLDGGNKSVVHFTATDGKRYSISLRTDGTISLWNATDGVTVARFSADGNDLYVGVNRPVWHSANFNPDTKFDKTGGPISGDITTSQGRIRLSYGSGVSYLQAGENAADTAAKMRITRMLSNSRLAEFEVLADSAKINGQEILTTGNKIITVTGNYAGYHADATAGTSPEFIGLIEGVRRGLIQLGDNIEIRRYAENGSTITNRVRLTDTELTVNGQTAWTNGNNAASLAQNGYQRFASGVIMQWGKQTNVDANTGHSVTFPIAFPNYCRSVVANTELSDQSAFASINIYWVDKTRFSFIYNNSGSSSTKNVNWIAFGY